MVILFSTAFVAIVAMGYVVANKLFFENQTLTDVPEYATKDFAVLDFVQMQLPDEENRYSHQEGIVAQVEDNNLTRVLTNGHEIIVPSVMLTKSED